MSKMNRRRERIVGGAAALALILLIPGHLLSQAPQEPPATEATLPLEQVAYIKASNAEAYDHFACGGGNQGHTGNSIALSSDGSTMAIGAPFESSAAAGINGDQSDNSAYASGAVYVLVRQGDSWIQQGYVKASNPGQSDHFGSSVVLSRDGNTMAVAAHFESSAATGINGNQNDNSIPQAGAVYIFARTGTTWSQEAYVKASNPGTATQGDTPGDGDQFGYSIALSGDGGTLAVGAITEDGPDNSQTSAGAVYVFTRTGSAWAQQALLKGSYVEGGNLFGFSVALSFDGNTLAGAAFNDRGSGRTVNAPHDTRANGSGAMYVFTRQNGGWSQQAYIKASRSELSDGLGFAVAISEDGNTLVVGSGDESCLTPGVDPPGCDNDILPSANQGPGGPQLGANIWVGAAYVFVRNGTTWTEQAFIKASNARPYSSFGVRLALSGDGNTLAVSAYLEDSAGQGVRPPVLQPFLLLESLNAWREHRNEAEESGAVYFYTRSGSTWTQGAYVKGSSTDAGDEFGSALALSGDGRLMVVGAHNEDSAASGVNGNQADNSGNDSGAAYVFAY